MDKFSRNIKKGWRAVSGGKRTTGRPAKLQKIKQEIEEALERDSSSSAVSQLTEEAASPQSSFDEAEKNDSILEEELETVANEAVSKPRPEAEGALGGDVNVFSDKVFRGSLSTLGRPPLPIEETVGEISQSNEHGSAAKVFRGSLSTLGSPLLPVEETIGEPEKRSEHGSATKVFRGSLSSLGSPNLRVMETVDEHDVAGVKQGEEASEETSEEAKRHHMYVIFNGEDASDYTDGPIRLIAATDGIKDGVALLMNLDLSRNIQTALRAQRDFARAERAALQQRKAILKFDRDLRSQVAGHKSRMAQLHEQDPDSGELAALAEELDILYLMMEDNKVRRQALLNNLEVQATMLREIQVDANAEVEQAFVFARLLEPEDDTPDTPVQAYDLQQEYQDFSAKLQATQDEDLIAAQALHTGKEHLQNKEILTPEQEHEREMKCAFDAAAQRLEDARLAFDRRDIDRALQLQANYDAVERGEEALDASPEDFDKRWVKRNQEITRELIEAESAVASAKAALVAEGIQVPEYDQASGFVDDVADGYRMSAEQAAIASVPSPKIRTWLNSVTSPASPNFNVRNEEADEWEAEEAGISDSVSVVAEGASRKRIDKWRKVCGL